MTNPGGHVIPRTWCGTVTRMDCRQGPRFMICRPGRGLPNAPTQHTCTTAPLAACISLRTSERPWTGLRPFQNCCCAEFARRHYGPGFGRRRNAFERNRKQVNGERFRAHLPQRALDRERVRVQSPSRSGMDIGSPVVPRLSNEDESLCGGWPARGAAQQSRSRGLRSELQRALRRAPSPQSAFGKLNDPRPRLSAGTARPKQ
jgi:hypothetical protein